MSKNNLSATRSLIENGSSIAVKVDKVMYTWTIINFDFFEAIGTVLKSPEFSASTNDKVKWFMELEPNGGTNSKDTLNLFLHLSDSSEYKSVFAKSSIFFLNEKLEKEYVMGNYIVKDFVAGNKQFLGCGLKDYKFRGKFLSNKALKIYCEVIFSTKSDAVIEHRCIKNAFSRKSSVAKCGCTENMARLFRTNHLSDVIISVSDMNYPAHKAILAVRSKVFAAMFQHDTKENQLNRIEIEDLSEEVVEEMLRYIYTGKCEKLDELAGILLTVADKYDLEGLKIICSDTLCKNLSIGNAAQNLLLADMHNLNELKNNVIKFIVSKRTEMFDTADWKLVLENPRLTNEVFRAMAAL